MDWGQFQAYSYFGITAIMVIVLYGYIYHIYNAQKTGDRDYEKYSKIALDDDIDSTPIEEKI